MRVVIMGCGRVGAGLATRLAAEQHHVTVLDTDAFAFRRLLPEFDGRRLVGSGTDDRMLVQAGIETADMFVAVASGDNRNILASQKAQSMYGVKVVVTRVKDPLRAELFGRLGLRTFSPTKVGIELAHDALFAPDGR
ncbi:MAG: TrkA family potassium uptake protein [Chloroflexi bacterium HGW-Chloroflexi-9]|jgi:trk system potassium uptake protein TrkA|nr:NAD-binding protein [Dehalococcoidia bacterium]PKN82828.1 MAG: TrkA family potassium uptake protein [Chloroflexi bacterium HGW-Chloroflexi-9]